MNYISSSKVIFINKIIMNSYNKKGYFTNLNFIFAIYSLPKLLWWHSIKIKLKESIIMFGRSKRKRFLKNRRWHYLLYTKTNEPEKQHPKICSLSSFIAQNVAKRKHGYAWQQILLTFINILDLRTSNTKLSKVKTVKCSWGQVILFTLSDQLL